MTIRTSMISQLIFSLCLLSTSCEQATSIRSICDKNSSFCSDLNQDGWCRKDKASVIRARLAFDKKPDDEQRYKLLTSFHAYKACIEIVAIIEPKTFKERRTTRVEGLLTATNEIERLSKETKNSDDPYLLLYHWTYNRDADAGNQFLAKQGTSELDKPIFLQALAYHYTNSDMAYSIKLLKRAISLTEGSYPNSLFESLTTMQLKSKQYEQAYIWALVAQKMGSKEVNEEIIVRYQSFNSEQIKLIKKQAKQIVEQIDKHKFKFPPVVRDSQS